MKPVPGLAIEIQPAAVLARMLLCGEARGEQDAGGTLESVAMLAVRWVVHTRTLRRRQSIAQVILAPWQFSCFNVNDPNRAQLLEMPALDPVSWERADTVCDLFEASFTSDPTGGADHYCTNDLWGRPAKDPDQVLWHELPMIESGRTRETSRFGHHVFGRHG